MRDPGNEVERMFGLFVRVLERGKFLYNKMAELRVGRRWFFVRSVNRNSFVG